MWRFESIKKKFVFVIFNFNKNIFILNIAIFANSYLNAYFYCKIWIIYLKFDKALIIISIKYPKFVNIFLLNFKT